jgi:hypothetical protein
MNNRPEMAAVLRRQSHSIIISQSTTYSEQSLGEYLKLETNTENEPYGVLARLLGLCQVCVDEMNTGGSPDVEFSNESDFGGVNWSIMAQHGV